MKLVTLAIVVCCAASAVNANRAPQVRRISILELLENKPGLRDELAAKIKANKDDPAPPVPATTSAPKTTTTTTTTAAPQANTPPDVPAETTTPASRGTRRRIARPRNGAARRRNPSVTEASEKFGDSGSNHRLRVVQEESEAPQRRNGRQFPGAS